MATFGWKVVHDGKTPPPGEVVKPDERLSWPRTVGLGAQHVIAMFGATFVFPHRHGAQPQRRDHDVRHRDDHVPADRPGQGAELPGHQRVVRRRGRRDPGGGRRRRLGDRRDPRRRRGARGLAGVAIHFLGARVHPQGLPARRHRRRRDADRLQPGLRRRGHLLAGRPVGRARDDGVRPARERRAARVLGPDRDPARPGLRVPALLAARRHRGPDHLGEPVEQLHRRAAPAAQPRGRSPRRRGSGCRSSTARASRSRRSCSCCPP